MDNLKPFDPQEVDESLVRVVVHAEEHYLLFPYVDGTGAAPDFKSVRHRIDGPKLTSADLLALATLIEQRGDRAVWFLNFNTPWLLSNSDAEKLKPRARTRPAGGR